jgi:hypothetical protein
MEKINALWIQLHICLLQMKNNLKCASTQRFAQRWRAILKWSIENGYDWDENTYMYAAMRGHFETLGRNIKMGNEK